MNPDPVLRLHQISKRFGSLVANDRISLDLYAGEILALLGENGAGKTTLMNILFGHYVADSGSIEAFGQPLKVTSPRTAITAGIGMVHQHFTLADNLTVLDNIMLGTEPLWGIWQNRSAAKQRLASLSNQFGLVVDPEMRVATLSVGERQRVEILKALYRQVKILILDEPTAVLTPQETAALFATLKQLTAAGLSIIFISHKLREVINISDRVIVLRSGQVVSDVPTKAVTVAQLAEQMVGRSLPVPKREPKRAGNPVLSLSDLTIPEKLHQVNLTVRQSEIVGIAGVSGNGQTTLFDVISGLTTPSQGIVRFYGKQVQPATPAGIIRAGVARIPEDRQQTGLIGDMNLWENLILETHSAPTFGHRGWLKRRSAQIYADRIIQQFDVRGATTTTPVRLLSGGNMQKLILGRVLAAQPRLIVASQPTRGLDLGAVTEVHQRLLAARSNGAGILLISEDLDELLTLCDRIYVLYRGNLSDSWPIEQVNLQELGLRMTGTISP